MSMLNIAVAYQEHFSAYEQQLEEAVRVSVQEGAQLVTTLARQFVPVETGSLQDTIDAEEVMDSGVIIQWSVNAGDTEGGYKGGGTSGKSAGGPVDYAEAQEYGGGAGAHTPFMTPAAEQAWQQYQELMADNIRDISE